MSATIGYYYISRGIMPGNRTPYIRYRRCSLARMVEKDENFPDSKIIILLTS